MSNREKYVPGPAAGAEVREGRREVDARSRPRASSPAGDGVAGADRSRAPAPNGRRSTPIGTWPPWGR